MPRSDLPGDIVGLIIVCAVVQFTGFIFMLEASFKRPTGDRTVGLCFSKLCFIGASGLAAFAISDHYKQASWAWIMVGMFIGHAEYRALYKLLHRRTSPCEEKNDAQ